MTHRTVLLSSFSEYLASDDDSLEDRLAEERERSDRMVRFPYGVMLQVSFPELDFANRWCWENFGPCDGECMQKQSEYSACDRVDPHVHEGTWTSHWFEKTDYNFGFNEWYFAERADQQRFLANVENINWGENYPK
jgi:hypothetical protein